MTLSEYLQKHEISDSAFARLIQTAPSTVMRLRKGERMPSLTMAQRIKEATGGDVTPNDFLTSEAA